MNAGTKRCVETFDKLSRGRWQTGLAALYAYEAQQPAVAKTKIDGLKSKYGLDTNEALGFFQVHESVDAWHSESEKNVCWTKFVKTQSSARKSKRRFHKPATPSTRCSTGSVKPAASRVTRSNVL